MFSNILVGVDGRQGGRDAIALAGQLAAPGARVTLAHVSPIEASDGADRDGDSHSMLSDERARAGIEARILAVPGSSVAHALHQLTTRRDYDLLVVGSCHRGAIARHVAGDNTIQTLKDARCAVAIAPQGYAAASEMSRVGVGWDGSPEAAHALEAAQAIAARTGGTIEPLLVLPRQSLPYGEPIHHRFSEVAQQLTSEDLERLGGLNGLDGQVRYGSPGEQLVCFSEDLDLLTVGSRNSGPLGRLLTGSTSNHLARHAQCPVLVFPRSVVAPG